MRTDAERDLLFATGVEESLSFLGTVRCPFYLHIVRGAMFEDSRAPMEEVF